LRYLKKRMWMSLTLNFVEIFVRQYRTLGFRNGICQIIQSLFFGARFL
jgi:hypothetical protein